MPNLTTVGLTGGLGTSGTGNMSTLDNLLGTAGTANTNVLTVQGIASGTAQPVSGTFWQTTQPVSGTVTANAGTNLNTSTLALETGGNLATIAGTVASSKVNVNVSSGSVTANAGTNLNTSALALETGGNLATLAGSVSSSKVNVHIDPTQLATLATTAQTMSAGFQLVGLPTDQPVPNKVLSQSNGATSSRVNAAASTNATNLKASAGALMEIDVFNVAAYSVFLKIYNKASSPTVGTDTPVWTIPIAAGTGYSKSFKYGKWLGTGVSYAITKLQADSDTTVVVAGDLTGSIDWI